MKKSKEIIMLAQQTLFSNSRTSTGTLFANKLVPERSAAFYFLLALLFFKISNETLFNRKKLNILNFFNNFEKYVYNY